MDTLIVDGDFDVDVSGYPKKIYGSDEAFQRAAIILSTEKGSFIYDRELGVDLSGVDDSRDIPKEIQLRCREALVDQKEISVGNVTVKGGSYSRVYNVEVIYGENVRVMEVSV